MAPNIKLVSTSQEKISLNSLLKKKLNLNDTEESLKINFEFENHDAGVWNEAIYRKKPGCVEENVPPPVNIGEEGRSGGEVEVPSGSGDDGGVRVNTIARRTYELDRYTKNAMLIINNKSEMENDEDVLRVKNVFEKYRFEIETITRPSVSDFVGKVEAFFEKDFTHCGALAIVVLPQNNNDRDLPRNRIEHEYILTAYFTEKLPAALKGKPIIYICEENGIAPRAYRNLQKYADIVQFRIPILFEVALNTRQRVILHTLLDQVDLFADNYDLMRIFTEVTRECMKIIDEFHSQSQTDEHFIVLPSITSTLLKEIHFARSL